MRRTGGLRLNQRDIHTLATLGEYGVLDRVLCHALCFADYSPEWCRQKLARLCAAGLLQATTLQVWHDEDGARGGRIPMLYSLTKAGGDIVFVRTGAYPRRVLRSDPSPATFWHRLQIVHVRVAFDLAASRERLPQPQWIHEQDLWLAAPKSAMPQHRRLLSHEFRDDAGTVITCRPDAAALLQIPHPSGEDDKATSLAIHFEIDRSREGLAQCQAKIPGYEALFEHRAFTRYWPALRNEAHRVFWVVPSRQRIETLCDAFREFPAAAQFRFSTFEDCRPERILTQAVWCDLQGTPLTLYNRLPSP